MSPAFRVQTLIAVTAVVLFTIKIVAWTLTGSAAILSDPLESVVNVVMGVLGLYIISFSARPKDQNHPYGHGKVEFVAAGIEGALIVAASFLIAFESIRSAFSPSKLTDLDWGLGLSASTAVVNLVVGYGSIRFGKRRHSPALVASGKHLLADVYSTVAIIIGLILVTITGLKWIDSVTAILMAGVVLYSGYQIIRSSLAGILDEQDSKLIPEIVATLDERRKTRPNWIDLHNLRVIKYGSVLHVDCHLTAPWYFNVHQAHDEVDAVEEAAREKFGDSVELFIHTDGCVPESCRICAKSECSVRQFPFVRSIHWSVSNVSTNSKHRLDSGD